MWTVPLYRNIYAEWFRTKDKEKKRKEQKRTEKKRKERKRKEKKIR